MAERLGDIGTRIDIEIRAGDSFVYDFTDQRDETGALIDFSSSTFDGALSLRGSSAADLPLTITVTALGAYRVAYSASTSGLTAGSFFNAAPNYSYKVRRTSSGITTTEYVGVVHVARELPE